MISALPDLQLAMGVNRVVPGVAIPYPLGDPTQGREGERRVRRAILRAALAALGTELEAPTLFPVDRDAGIPASG